jgi:hypothetical protein
METDLEDDVFLDDPDMSTNVDIRKLLHTLLFTELEIILQTMT